MDNYLTIERFNAEMEKIVTNPDTGELMSLEEVRALSEEDYQTFVAYQNAVAALNKQIAIPAHLDKEKGMLYCPKCGCPTQILCCSKGNDPTIYVYPRIFCRECGQMLMITEEDWEDGQI